jgi:hypothetical protein
MNGWILIITLAFPGSPDQTSTIGIIFDPAVCEVIGTGLSRGLEAQNPGLRARWACHAMDGEAA